MKVIKFSPKFKAMFKRFISKDEKLIKEYLLAVDIFLEDPQRVNDHPLRDNLCGYRAFSINPDIRVIYREREDIFIFLKVGPHDEVYK